MNQCDHVYLEECDISGAVDNAIDYVAVQYGHALRNRIHNSRDWAMYVKGGSAYLLVEGNEFFDAGTGGFTAGQGSGFQFLTSPWIHYEAMDVKVVNNAIHDTEGAGLGVNGGYNILLAYNTLFRVGRRSHMLEVVYGLRSCDGQPGDPGRERCADYLAKGGWGTTVVDDGSNAVRIPNRNVFILNNILYNPATYPALDQVFNVPGPFPGPTQAGSNAPDPARADDNLSIAGNVIWTGRATPLGIEDSGNGCRSDNPICNETRIRADNAIETFEPIVRDPVAPDLHLADPTGPWKPVAPLPFPGGDRPSRPVSPAGKLINRVTRDANGATRYFQAPAGAYVLQVLPDPGDLDADGGVTVADVMIELKFFLGLRTPTAHDLIVGDPRPSTGQGGRTFGDGAIRADDLNWIVRRYLGVEGEP